MFSEYGLRGSLVGHQEDARAVIVCDIGIVTASRDKTIKIWTEAADGTFTCTKTLAGHTGYVTALAYKDGELVSGSADQSVFVWDLEKGTPRHRLRGHGWAVTAVAISDDKKIISASQDSTIRVWNNGACEAVLEGHTKPVHCLLVLPSGAIVSGSGDCTIRIWQDGQSKVLKGHTDTVRGLALVPNIGFVSASHDFTLRVWDLEGRSLSLLQGHQAIIYSAAVSSDGFLIASASEDKTSRLWALDGTLHQTLVHPGCIWDVAFLDNGDLVTACSDSNAYIWTPDMNRVAPADVVAVFEGAVEANKPGAGKTEDGDGVPSGLQTEPPSALMNLGMRDGEQKFIKEAGGVFVYVWSVERQKWDKIGQVTLGPEETTNTGPPSNVLHGRTWDYVVDVELQSGTPGAKLAFNRDENPYIVADRWLMENDMPSEFREQIVEFILGVVGREGASVSQPSSNVDPFTGGGSYVPGSGGPTPGTGFSGGLGSADPFTGVGAYVPGSWGPTPGSGPVSSGNADPFTGQGAYTLGGAGQASPKSSKHIPHLVVLKYDTIPKAGAVAGKIREFNATVASLPNGAELALGAADVAPGGPLDRLVERATSAGSPGDYALLLKLLKWPRDQIFPALDLARLAALSPAGASALASSGEVASALRTAASSNGEGPAVLTALRFICNAFVQLPLRNLAEKKGAEWLQWFAASGCGITSPANVRQAWAAFLLNLTVVFKTMGKCPEDVAVTLVSALSSLLPGHLDDLETTYRSLLAVGNLAAMSVENRQLAQQLGLGEAIESCIGMPGKVGEAAVELNKLLAYC